MLFIAHSHEICVVFQTRQKAEFAKTTPAPDNKTDNILISVWII